MLLLQMRMKPLTVVMMNDFVICFNVLLNFVIWFVGCFVPWILAPSECMVCTFNSALWILNLPVLAHFVDKKGE